MFFPPSFDPHSPIEPQWFPRPITDSFESQLDQLERLEEDRKRRLRSIANVPAKTPIGCGAEAAAPNLPGSAASSSVSGNHSRSHNSYSQHRYYPPPAEAEEAASSFDHRSHDGRAPVHLTLASASATASRRRHYRNIRVPRSSNNSSSVDVAGRDNNPSTDLSHLSHSHISHDVSDIRTSVNDSFQGSTTSLTMSSPLFHSPPFDPRGGGGQRNSGWYQNQLGRHQLAQHPQYTSYDAELTTPTNLAFLAGDQSGAHFDITTPEDQGVTSTPGHGHSEDVYSQRRRGHRRRRMG